MNAAAPFLSMHRHGPAGKTAWAAHAGGFWCLAYDDDGLIGQVGWVRRRGDRPKAGDLQLWFDWVNDLVTFKTEAGLSGTCWSDGYVSFDTVYDDDDPGPGTAVELDAWVDQCVGKMVAAESPGPA